MSCISPYYTNVRGNWIPVPCGRCPPCKKRRVDGWVFRLMEEDKISSSAHFITLTYDNAHVPLSPNGFMTLYKDEFPLYMKRLRKLCSGHTLKYYACGEYGSRNNRPHYHAIVFNCPDEAYFFDAWKRDDVHFGEVHVGRVSGNSVAYTMKYIDKRKGVGMHERDDRVPEFALMSKRLGRSYIDDNRVVEYHNADLTRNYLVKEGGHKIALPRYYRDKLYDDDARAAMGANAERAHGIKNSERYRRWQQYHQNAGTGLTWEQYKDSIRRATVNKFYSSQKERL